MEIPEDVIVNGKATLTDASENENVLCIVELNPLSQKVSEIDRTRGDMGRTCLGNRCNEIHAGGYLVGWHWWEPQ